MKPPADKVYSSGPVRTNNIVYRNVTINGTAYIPVGEPVEVRALENIFMEPDFESPVGTDFWAHIVADSGAYQYDAIGNLILDQAADLAYIREGGIMDSGVWERSSLS